MQTEEEKKSTSIQDALREKLQKYLRETFEPLGFTVNSNGGLRWKRESKTLQQFCTILFPRPRCVRMQFWYSSLPCFDCWQDVPQDSRTMLRFERFKKEWIDFAKGVIDFDELKDWDIPSAVEEIDELISEIDVYVKQETLPLLNKYQNTSDILKDYDQGLIGDEYVCGAPGWFDFKLAILRYQDEKYEQAFELFQNFLVFFANKRTGVQEHWSPLLGGAELAVEALEKRLGQKSTFKQRIKRQREQESKRSPDVVIKAQGKERLSNGVGNESLNDVKKALMKDILLDLLNGKQGGDGK